MEEEQAAAAALSTSLQNPNPNLPTNKKHLAMLERLSNRQTQTNKSSNQPSTESTSSFLSLFSQKKTSIENQLQASRSLTGGDPSKLKTHFDSISPSISDLEKLLAENSYYLPSYELRSSLKTISDLKQTLENLNSELIPRKKFSFKNKPLRKEPVNVVETKPVDEPSRNPPAASNYTFPDSEGIRNCVGEVLVRNFRGSEIGEFTLSGIESCDVRLIGSVRTVFMHKLRKCRIHSGPVLGSILIDEAEDCVFVLASHQIRIHNVERSDFYLRVRSRPIIEDCSSVRFAPYCLRYDGIEDDLRNAGLDEESGNWANVDDFKWLRAVQSPNWSVLPDGERIEVIDISNSRS